MKHILTILTILTCLIGCSDSKTDYYSNKQKWDGYPTGYYDLKITVTDSTITFSEKDKDGEYKLTSIDNIVSTTKKGAKIFYKTTMEGYPHVTDSFCVKRNSFGYITEIQRFSLGTITYLNE